MARLFTISSILSMGVLRSRLIASVVIAMQTPVMGFVIVPKTGKFALRS